MMIDNDNDDWKPPFLRKERGVRRARVDLKDLIHSNELVY